MVPKMLCLYFVSPVLASSAFLIIRASRRGRLEGLVPRCVRLRASHRNPPPYNVQIKAKPSNKGCRNLWEHEVRQGTHQHPTQHQDLDPDMWT
jgi:hypothetical protein